jgi:hypothetical protein
MLQIGRMRINLLNRLKIRKKNQSIKLHSNNDNNSKENLSNNNATSTVPSPLLTDMEFNWIQDY